MNKIKIVSVLFIMTIGLSLMAASDSIQKTSLQTFETLNIHNLWLNTTNPAALSQTEGVLPGMLNTSFVLEDGNFKRVQQGENFKEYSFNTFSYTKINDINFYGGFRYEKSFEEGIDFSNMNDPFRLTPYQLVDTLGNDMYDREFFSAAGGISKPFGENWVMGLSLDFKVGLSAQDKDPRPQNKVFNMTLSPGFIYTKGKLKLGMNFLYKYYNEEIEIKIIEENAQATFFSVHGLGLSIYHEAASFNRLYERNAVGSGFQLAYDFSTIKIVSGVRFLYHKEKAGDGRKASNASWSYLKKDSELDALQLDIFNHTTITRPKVMHYLGFETGINSMIGTEIIQRLEQVNDTDLDDWITYAKEEKYEAQDIKARVFYEYLRMKNSQKVYGFRFQALYHDFSQEYYIPSQKENYRNLKFGLDFNRCFELRKGVLTAGAGFDYKFNIDGEQFFTDYTFLAEKIMAPDYEFLTSDYYAARIEFAYEIPMKKIFDQYFIKSTVDTYQGENGRSRTILKLSTGVTF